VPCSLILHFINRNGYWVLYWSVWVFSFLCADSSCGITSLCIYSGYKPWKTCWLFRAWHIKGKTFWYVSPLVIYFNYIFISTVLLYWHLQFQRKSSEALSDDPTSSLLFAGDDEERYILFLKYQFIVTMLILRWDSFLFVKTYRYCLAFVCRHTSYCNYKLCFQIFELLYLFMFSRFLLNKGFSSHKYN
jgi:hypothetical protein